MRDQFPILEKTVNGYPLIYFDNAATMQMPGPVMHALEEFYRNFNSNIHRGTHSLSQEATRKYEKARETVRAFLDAEAADEIIFTSGTTASINMAAQMMAPQLHTGDQILVTMMEHHSNLLPWMELAKRQGLELLVTPICEDGSLDLKAFEKC